MKKRNAKKQKRQEKSKRFSARASLIAIGQFAKRWKLFDIIGQKVLIAQKVVKYTPIEKLTDAFISILAGAKGLYEVNKRVRPDQLLQLAFGRTACAEQSTISETLNAVTADNVQQMNDSVSSIYQQYSRGYRHPYHQRFQLLDVDMSGMPCGKKAKLASKGYFANQKNRRGRQLGRVCASHYQEVVTSKLYFVLTQLNRAFQPLVVAAEGVLGLDEAQRKRTILRTDAGGGRDEDINWLLSRQYLFITKAYSAKRAEKVLKSVHTWHPDKKVKGREAGLVLSPHAYVLPTLQIGVRSHKKNGQWSYHLLVTNLSLEPFQQLYYLPAMWRHCPEPILWFALGSYDLRGGGCETAFKADKAETPPSGRGFCLIKQGLGITKRNKKQFEAQQMLVLLADLAHNLCIWVKTVLVSQCRRFAPVGILSLVRDVFTISGQVVLDAKGHIKQILLNQRDPFAEDFQQAIQPFLNGITVNLGKI